MLYAVRSSQFRENAVIISHEQIAALGSMSVRKVVECEHALEALGLLRVKRFGLGRANSYQAIRAQGHLFDRDVRDAAISGISAVEKPVQYVREVENPQQPPAQTGAAPVHAVQNSPPGGVHAVHTLSVSTSENSNSKPGAEVRADPLFPVDFQELPPEKRREIVLKRIARHFEQKKEADDRRKVEARDRREAGVEPRKAPSASVPKQSKGGM